MKKRKVYALLFVLLLGIEVCIALFVRDRFIRPYGGDILVTVLLCCLGRVMVPEMRFLPGLVFGLAVLVEVGQYVGLVDLLGLGEIRFWRILLGSTFSWADVVCYGVGCALFWLGEKSIDKWG